MQLLTNLLIMKEKNFSKKLELKKSLIANLNYSQMKNIIGASEKTAVRATDGTGDSILEPGTVPPPTIQA